MQAIRRFRAHRKNRKSQTFAGYCSRCADPHCIFNVTPTKRLPDSEGNAEGVRQWSCSDFKRDELIPFKLTAT